MVLQLLTYKGTESYLFLLIYPVPIILSVLSLSFTLLGGGERNILKEAASSQNLFLLHKQNQRM